METYVIPIIYLFQLCAFIDSPFKLKEKLNFARSLSRLRANESEYEPCLPTDEARKKKWNEQNWNKILHPFLTSSPINCQKSLTLQFSRTNVNFWIFLGSHFLCWISEVVPFNMWLRGHTLITLACFCQYLIN